MTYEAKIRPWLLIVLLVVIAIGIGFTFWYFYSNKGKTTTATSPTPTLSAAKKSPTASPSPNSTATPTPTNDLTYTNEKYKFTLTLPASWKGYKMKEANFDGSLNTYYMNVPTSDQQIGQASISSDAGYYAPFAISVYTPDQWAAIENSGGPIDLLITKNDQYVFGWSHANGVQPEDWTKESDIKDIIASFKISS